MKYFVHRGSQYTLETEELSRTTVTAPNWQERTRNLRGRPLHVLPADHWSLVVRTTSKKNIANHAYRRTNTLLW